MPYTVRKYDGTPIVTVPDRTLDTTSTDIKIPGRNYPSYGEPVVDDLVWILENFAGINAPTNPLEGQLWYNTLTSSMMVYDGTQWTGTGKTIVGATTPVVDVSGQFWYDTNRQQVFVSDVTLPYTWKLVGPIGAANGDDGTADVPTYSALDAVVITDNTGNIHPVMRVTVGGILLAIISNATFIPQTPITGFSTIGLGITLNSSISNIGFVGNASSTTLSENTSLFAGFPTTTFMRNDQTNAPVTNNAYSLGSVTNGYASIYATVFNGTATAAKYSDLAERYESDTILESGTVVIIGGEKEISTCAERGSTEVFGVISTAPGLKMNSDAGDDKTHPYVAFSGRVPVKTIGVVKKGQRLMSSSVPGVAEAWEETFGILSIIGRSLSEKTTSMIETIEVVVGTK